MRSAGPCAFAALACLAVAVSVGCARGGPPRGEPSPVSAGVMDTAGMTRIRFARGTTSGILNDSLAAGGEHVYLLGAEQGQVLLAHAIAWSERGAAPRGETVVRVHRADGGELAAPSGAGPLWTGRLPYTGDYVVRVRAIGGPTPYTLAVQIPRRLEVGPEDPSASLSGTAPSRVPVDYLIRGEAGRRLEVELRAEGDDAHLHVYGLDDGVQLARLADRQRRYAGRLPGSQDYVISVVPTVEGTRYGLRVILR